MLFGHTTNFSMKERRKKNFFFRVIHKIIIRCMDVICFVDYVWSERVLKERDVKIIWQFAAVVSFRQEKNGKFNLKSQLYLKASGQRCRWWGYIMEDYLIRDGVTIKELYCQRKLCSHTHAQIPPPLTVKVIKSMNKITANSNVR